MLGCYLSIKVLHNGTMYSEFRFVAILIKILFRAWFKSSTDTEHCLLSLSQ